MREFEQKSFGPFEIKDEDAGQVTAIVASLEVVDRDGDVIMPGSIPMGGAKVKLSGYGHDVITQDAPPVGIGTISEEGGKAIFDGRFFMSTERGREAFLTVKELGADGEWSFGFPNSTVKTSKVTDEWKSKGARRMIVGMDPVEASPVFRGAGLGTMTMHVKAMKADDDSLTDRISAVNDALHAYNEALPEDERARYWWGREVFDDHVIVEAGAELFRVDYTMDEDGNVVLGEATKVEVVYQAVGEKAGESDEETKTDDAPEADGDEADTTEGDESESEPEEAEAEDGEDEEEEGDGVASVAEAKATAAMEEYQRVQRTLKRLGVA